MSIVPLIQIWMHSRAQYQKSFNHIYEEICQILNEKMNLFYL